MDCRRADAILNEHAQASLDPAEEAQVAAHLKACPRCADAWRGQQLATGELPKAPRDGFYAAVRAQALGAPGQPWTTPMP